MAINLKNSKLWSEKPTVLIGISDPLELNDCCIDEVMETARQSPEGNARILLHSSRNDTLQEMIIALPKHKLYQPHSNYKSGKSFFILRGEMSIVCVTPDGTPKSTYFLSTDAPRSTRILRLNETVYHTPVPWSSYVVFLETVSGPFERNKFAPGSPAESDTADWHNYAARIIDFAKSS